MLPKMYEWLSKLTAPAILVEAVKLFGTKELSGKENNPVILGWAQEIGGWVGSFYKDDGTPWCGLFVGLCAKRAGIPFGQKLLGAKNWESWGTPAKYPMLGDVLIFTREGGGHVGLYVAEDKEAYHVLGGNQGDQVSIARIAKDRLYVARYGTECDGRKRIFIDPATGKLSDEPAHVMEKPVDPKAKPAKAKPAKAAPLSRNEE